MEARFNAKLNNFANFHVWNIHLADLIANTLFYKQIVSVFSPQSCLYFQGVFLESELLKDALSSVRQFFGNLKSFKSDEKWFLFHLKSFFHSQDI